MALGAGLGQGRWDGPQGTEEGQAGGGTAQDGGGGGRGCGHEAGERGHLWLLISDGPLWWVKQEQGLLQGGERTRGDRGLRIAEKV